MMDEAIFCQAKKLHFVGIGGSGMFPIVQILLTKGYEITGSDNNEGDIITKEREMGIPVIIGHSAANIGNADALVYSAAIMQENVELTFARERGIPAFERCEVLGYLTRQFDNCICVSGTHGKTTTTAMLTQLLLESGMDPSAVIGGKLPAIDGYGRSGASQIMTCEACEFNDTFLHLSPDISVILNIDADHLDYFGSMDNIIKSFRKFTLMTSRLIIINGDDDNSRKAVEGIEKNIVTFGFGRNNDYIVEKLVSNSPVSTSFDLCRNSMYFWRFTVNVPGRHNVLNATAAIVAAIHSGAEPAALGKSLPNFRGAGRRFEILGERNGITIADDYAHHPVELKATLETAMKMGYGKVWAVFQPFTFSRTALLLNEFADALAIPDHVVMSEIMGGREANTYNIYTRDLAKKIPNSVWFPEFEQIAEYVLAHARPGDLILTLGCGDIYKCARMILTQ